MRRSERQTSGVQRESDTSLLLEWLYVTRHRDGRMVLEPRSRHAEMGREDLRRLGYLLVALSFEEGPPVRVDELLREQREERS
jgi:hypothetical protein